MSTPATRLSIRRRLTRSTVKSGRGGPRRWRPTGSTTATAWPWTSALAMSAEGERAGLPGLAHGLGVVGPARTGRETAALSDTQLRARVTAWRQEQAWALDHVGTRAGTATAVPTASGRPLASCPCSALSRAAHPTTPPSAPQISADARPIAGTPLPSHTRRHQLVCVIPVCPRTQPHPDTHRLRTPSVVPRPAHPP